MAVIRHLPSQIGKAENENDKDREVCEDATRLSFDDGYFDAVFLFGVLDHITEWRKAVSEVFRVLKIGGIFSFEDFLLGKSSRRRFGHVSIGEEELKGALASSGFTIRSFEMRKRLPRCFVRAVKNSYSSQNEKRG